MNLKDLIARLTAIDGVQIAEEQHQPDGTIIYIFCATLPTFPFGHQKHVWYPLVVKPGETEIPKSEVEAILRRLWHGSSSEFFRETLH